MNEPSLFITGGSGFLGREVAAVAQQNGIPFTIASRTNPAGMANWVHLDLEQDGNFDELLRGHSVVLHLASGTRVRSRIIDVEGTKRLVRAAKNNGVRHVVYISIVGIDSVPTDYYQSKLLAEREIIASGIPYTILRTTQFHGFVDFMLQRLLRYRIAFLPIIQVQPIDISVVARSLVQRAKEQPRNAIVQLGGKEIFGSRELAEICLKHRRQKRIIVGFPLPGKAGTAMRNGALTCAERTKEGLSWSEWVAIQYPRR
jgi:uncharacterized protein YbjT (DUF2867 family)